MGPPGLWAELRRKGAATELHGQTVDRLLTGKTVAVDAAVWFYEARCQADIRRIFGDDGAVLKVTFERVVRWLRKGVLPVVVLEGDGGGRAHRTFSRGWSKLGAAFSAQPKVRALLTALGVPWVNAEGEAEATCAALALSGVCDFVATTDFDALLFGAPKVLKGLDLREDSSKCELWDMEKVNRVAGVDRHGLIAATFLVGCDYDCRSQSQASQQDGHGVQGVGPRQALSIAQVLRGDGQVDALKVLADVLSNSVDHESALAGNPQFRRLLSRAAEDPTCIDGLEATVRQYNRAPSFTIDGPFAWRGVDEFAAAEALAQVFKANRVTEKLDPLLLEWSLRVVAAECPSDVRADATRRRQWAQQRGLRYVPLSAVTARRRKSRCTPYAVVRFARADGDGTPMALPYDKRRARVSLVNACCLMDDGAKDTNVASLKVVISQIIKDCPDESKQSSVQLRGWLQHQGLRLAPKTARIMRCGRVRLLWCDAASGKLVPGVYSEISVQEAGQLGGEIAAGAGHSGIGTTQRRLSQMLFRRRTTLRKRYTKSRSGSERTRRSARGSESSQSSDDTKTSSSHLLHSLDSVKEVGSSLSETAALVMTHQSDNPAQSQAAQPLSQEVALSDAGELKMTQQSDNPARSQAAQPLSQEVAWIDAGELKMTQQSGEGPACQSQAAQPLSQEVALSDAGELKMMQQSGAGPACQSQAEDPASQTMDIASELVACSSDIPAASEVLADEADHVCNTQIPHLASSDLSVPVPSEISSTVQKCSTELHAPSCNTSPNGSKDVASPTQDAGTSAQAGLLVPSRPSELSKTRADMQAADKPPRRRLRRAATAPGPDDKPMLCTRISLPSFAGAGSSAVACSLVGNCTDAALAMLPLSSARDQLGSEAPRSQERQAPRRLRRVATEPCGNEHQTVSGIDRAHVSLAPQHSESSSSIVDQPARRRLRRVPTAPFDDAILQVRASDLTSERIANTGVPAESGSSVVCVPSTGNASAEAAAKSDILVGGKPARRTLRRAATAPCRDDEHTTSVSVLMFASSAIAIKTVQTAADAETPNIPKLASTMSSQWPSLLAGNPSPTPLRGNKRVLRRVESAPDALTSRQIASSPQPKRRLRRVESAVVESKSGSSAEGCPATCERHTTSANVAKFFGVALSQTALGSSQAYRFGSGLQSGLVDLTDSPPSSPCRKSVSPKRARASSATPRRGRRHLARHISAAKEASPGSRFCCDAIEATARKLDDELPKATPLSPGGFKVSEASQCNVKGDVALRMGTQSAECHDALLVPAPMSPGGFLRSHSEPESTSGTLHDSKMLGNFSLREPSCVDPDDDLPLTDLLQQELANCSRLRLLDEIYYDV